MTKIMIMMMMMMTKTGMNVEKGNTYSLMVGMQIGVATMKIHVEVPQKLKIDPPHKQLYHS